MADVAGASTDLGNLGKNIEQRILQPSDAVYACSAIGSAKRRCSPVRCLIKLNESNKRHYRSVVTAQTMCLLGMCCLRSSGLGALKMACGEDEEPQSHSQ